MTNDNPLKNTRIEFHILQSFPVTCLNRDDVGAPKTAVVGDTTRARVSSQCWKRQVRLTMHEFGVKLGIRTKFIMRLIEEACLNEGATLEQARNLGQLVSAELSDSKKDSEQDTTSDDDKENKGSTLLFIADQEVLAFAKKMKEFSFSFEKLDQDIKALEKETKELKKGKNKENASELKNKEAVLKQLKKTRSIPDMFAEGFSPDKDGLDIALFGRMVANAASMNIEAAASFSHAISTHKISNDVEFFTALDDRPELSEKPGSSHMGSLEFNSATYYRYISLDLGQLYQTLKGIALPEAIEVFTKALFVAIPSARQTTQSGASPWEFAKIFVRKGQRLQVPFETAIKVENGGFLQPSIEALKEYLTKKEKLFGSLFGKKAEYTFGEDENFSIDNLVAELKQQVTEIVR